MSIPNVYRQADWNDPNGERWIAAAWKFAPVDAQVSFRVTNIASTPPEADSFDLRLTCFSMIFFNDSASASHHMRRVLKPGRRASGDDRWPCRARHGSQARQLSAGMSTTSLSAKEIASP
jgi:hypothetical protein